MLKKRLLTFLLAVAMLAGLYVPACAAESLTLVSGTAGAAETWYMNGYVYANYLDTTITSINTAATYTLTAEGGAPAPTGTANLTDGISFYPYGWGHNYQIGTDGETTTYKVSFNLGTIYDISRLDVADMFNTTTNGVKGVSISAGKTQDAMSAVEIASTTATAGSSSVYAHHSNNALISCIFATTVKGVQYVDVTLSVLGVSRLGEVMIFGGESTEMMAISAISDNAFTAADIQWYKNNENVEVTSVETGVTYTWVKDELSKNRDTNVARLDDDYNTDGIRGEKNIADGNLTSQKAEHIVPGTKTTGVIYDFGKAYNISRVDVHEIANNANSIYGVKVYAGDKLGALSLKTTVSTGYSTATELTHRMHKATFADIEARYVVVEIILADGDSTTTDLASYNLGDIVIFGSVSDNASLTTIKALSGQTFASNPTYYKNAGFNMESIATGATGEWATAEECPAVTKVLSNVPFNYVLDGGFDDTTNTAGVASSVFAATIDLKAPRTVNRIDFCYNENVWNGFESITVYASNTKDGLYEDENLVGVFDTSAGEGKGFYTVISGASVIAPYEFTAVEAQYVGMVFDNDSKADSDNDTTLRQIVIFGEDSKFAALQASIAAALEYDNYIPYDDADWAALQNAIDAGDSLLGNESATAEAIAAAVNAIDDAVENLGLRGGQQILSPNTFIHRDYDAFYARYPELSTANLANVTARFMTDDDGYTLDAHMQTKNIEELFDGGPVVYSGNDALWSNSPAGATYVLFDLGEECWINGADIRTMDYRQFNGSTRSVGGLAVSVSDDGVNFTPAGEMTAEEITSDDIGRYFTRITSVTFPAVKARYARVEILSALGVVQYILMEMWLRGRVDDTNKVIVTKNDTNDMVTAKTVLDGNEESARLALAIYDNRGNLENVALSAQKNLIDGKAVISVEAPIAAGQNAKGMAFDSLETIKPVALYGVASNYTEADFEMTNLLSDGAIIQRGKNLAVFGTATTGTKVSVDINGDKYDIVADEDGKWLALGDVVEEGEFYDVSATANGTTLTAKNLVPGDVWLCSGQSNMDYTFALMGNEELPTDTYQGYTDFKYFLVPNGSKTATEPVNTVNGEWVSIAGLTTSELAELSALATLSGMELSDYTGVPIGIIDASVGGTFIDEWMSIESLKPLIEADTIGAWEITRHSYLFNEMINPLIPYGIKGVLWYQGCHNVNNFVPGAYLNLEKAWIDDWRDKWGDEELPFIITQLCTYRDDRFTYIRDQQLALRDERDNVGVITTMDVGDVAGTVGDDVHPREKKAVAERLIRTAAAVAYGDTTVEYLFPVMKSVTLLSDGSVDVVFDDVYDGLEMKAGDSALAAFKLEINGTAYDATATIKSADTVNVKVDGIVKPDAIAFAYEGAPDPEVNLFNSAGLSAAPFYAELD